MPPLDTTPITLGTRYRTLTYDDLTMAADIVAPTINYHIDEYVKERELDFRLDDLVRKIYRIIKDTARLDISEEDFIKLIQDN